MKVEYSSNNSGGGWWLSDEDWKNLEAAGWQVNWIKNDPYFAKYQDGDARWLGALATRATVEAPSVEAAIAEFERITGQDANAEGCPCCGSPHYFSEAWEG